MGESFAVFIDFLQTMKVFSSNFIGAILSANIYIYIYTESCFYSCQPQKYILN